MPFDVSILRSFVCERVLNEDTATRTIFLLGTFSNNRTDGELSKAILKIQRTALEPEVIGHEIGTAEAEVIGSTDIYTWLWCWFTEEDSHGGEKEKARRTPDVKIDIISPATEVHIRKYTKQEIVMVHETPEVYERVVRPYIEGFPESRTKWVNDILSGESESDNIVFSNSEFVILPDMKWDSKIMSALYLVAIVRSGDVRSLRDLRTRHLGLLKAIRKEARTAVRERWGMEEGAVRMYVHYQPSYYHFHVHIVNANQSGMMGMAVGQAHLLDDVISLIEMDGDVFGKITLTYGLGDQHGLYEGMRRAQ